MYEGGCSGPYISAEPFIASQREDTPQPEADPEDISRSTSDSPKNRKSSLFRANLEERLSRHGPRSTSPGFSSSSSRRLQKQMELSEPSRRLSVDASEKGSTTPSMRKRYLKELFLNNRSALSSFYSSKPGSSKEEEVEEDAEYGGDTFNNEGELWALDPMEHAWMLSVVDGNYETMVEFLAEDPSLLGRKDFISGFTALHWLAKNGKDEMLIHLLRHAEKKGLQVNVNLRGSGGLTPLHVAAMHSQNMVVKVLIGAFGANVDVMDYNGKRAWQYLNHTAPNEIKALLGAWDEDHSFGNTNNSASQAQPIEELTQETHVEVNKSARVTRQRFTSIKKLLYNVGLLEKI
ncbi:hypothetical protein DNTS_000292 [Danionella cerebrum]|uniref:Uncharacterized protein n=1 Tax=Danionella cerebrum TaxID=2873325 RepID=A0A553R730_9TELE|nr:hypothetical protein DNTS_000292 [Danionella translucida]